jgi:hypothetical protein
MQVPMQCHLLSVFPGDTFDNVQVLKVMHEKREDRIRHLTPDIVTLHVRS